MPDTSAQQSFSISEQVAGARSDEEFRNFLTSNRRATVSFFHLRCLLCRMCMPLCELQLKQSI